MTTLLLLLLQVAAPPPPPDSVVRAVRTTLRPFADTAAARKAGFVPLAVGRFQDGTPFQGIHWIHLRRFRNPGAGLSKPTFLLYAPVKGRLTLVGAAFSERITARPCERCTIASPRRPSTVAASLPSSRWHLAKNTTMVTRHALALMLAMAVGAESAQAHGYFETRWTLTQPARFMIVLGINFRTGA